MSGMPARFAARLGLGLGLGLRREEKSGHFKALKLHVVDSRGLKKSQLRFCPHFVRILSAFLPEDFNAKAQRGPTAGRATRAESRGRRPTGSFRGPLAFPFGFVRFCSVLKMRLFWTGFTPNRAACGLEVRDTADWKSALPRSAFSHLLFMRALYHGLLALRREGDFECDRSGLEWT